MSEENKDQVQSQNEPKQEGEPQQKLYAGKFKNESELEKGYLELQKKLGDRQPPNDESPKPPKADEDDKEEYAWKQKNAALDAQQAVIDARKKEAAEVLADGDTLSAVRRALGDSTAVSEFEQEFDKGQVSASEVRRLAKLGGHKPENAKTIPEPTDNVAQQANEAEVDYMLKMLKNSNSAYFNQKASDHKAVVAKVNEIKHRVGIA